MTSRKGKRRRTTTPRPETRPVRATTGGARRTKVAPRRGDEVRRRYLIAGALVAAVVGVLLLAVVVLPELLPGTGAGAPSASPSRAAIAVDPPDATPLASPPAEPAGDGTRATIETEFGSIVIELFNQSSPVAAQNFVNLAEAGYYDGVVFHRIVPGFMIQGGDPEGTGGGGPGYGIPDEPIVGEYVRGTVAMARTSQPNSQGSQFFIVVEDSPHLAGGGYAIFGRVVSGMEVADQIVAGERGGPQNDLAVDPVVMSRVTIQRP